MRPYWRFEAHKGQPVTLLARVQSWSGQPIKQASLRWIKYRVYRWLAGTEAETIALTDLTIADVLHDTMQGTRLSKDPRWTNDCRPDDLGGFNFEFKVPSYAFPGPGEYRVEVIFKELIGDLLDFEEQFSIIWRGPVHSSYGNVADPVTIAGAVARNGRANNAIATLLTP